MGLFLQMIYISSFWEFDYFLWPGRQISFWENGISLHGGITFG